LIKGVNNAWVQLCGYTAAEAIGQTCKILQCPETANETREALQQLQQALKEQQS
jgi:PAS domain S-box-containing protein